MKKHAALTIAGSDSSGGAGVQADIKTMTVNGVFAESAITSLTAQNTTGVTDILDATPDFLSAELDAVFTDIVPEAVKIGMVSASELINVIADKLKQYHADHIVVDPVMVATSGAKLISEDAISTLCSELLPLAEVITPNIPETGVLLSQINGGSHEDSQNSVESPDDMEKAAEKISSRFGCSVLVKGGHNLNDANDYLYDRQSGEGHWIKGKRIDNHNTHGTGCTLSSAIASNLAKGYDLLTSVKRAKEYISGALAAMLDLGKGSGPMDHAFDVHGKWGNPEMTEEEAACGEEN